MTFGIIRFQKSKRVFKCICWGIVLLFLAGEDGRRPVLAETLEEVTELPPYIVSEKAIHSFELAEEEAARNPTSTVLISNKEIQNSRGYNLEDVLQFAPGVFSQSRGGGSDGKISIRGTNLSSNVNTWGITLLVDGIPMNAADGFTHLESIDLMAVDHIEVYKGAQAVKFGANSIGGAINFILKKGPQATPVQVRGEVGSFGYYNSQISSGMANFPFPLLGKIAKSDYYVSLTGSGQHGYRTNSQQAALRFNANFGLMVDGRHQARLTIISTYIYSELPGPLSKTQFETDPRQAGAQLDVGGNPIVCERAEPCRYSNDNQLNRVGVAYRYTTDGGDVLSISPFYQYWSWLSRWTQFLDQLTQDTGAEIRFTQTAMLFGKAHRWIVGTSPWYGENRLDIYKNEFGNRGAILQKRFIKTLNLGTYLEDNIEVIPNLTLTVGGRLDYSSRDATVTDFSPPGTAVGSRTGDRIFSAISPKLGVVYQTNPATQLYGNVSRGYEAPVNVQLMQPLNANGTIPTGAFLDVDAQRAWQFELGHRGTGFNGDLSWDIVAYDLEMRKELMVTVLTVPGIGEVATFRNAKATRHNGVEAGGRITIAKGLLVESGEQASDRLSLRGTYTWRRLHFLDDVYKVSNGVTVLDAKDGNTIPGIPEHWISGEVRYDHPAGFWVAPNFQWSPAGYFLDNDNTLKNPPFFIVNLKLGYTSKTWGVFFEGRNLTDQNYAGSAFAGGTNITSASTSRLFLPSWPVSFFGGLEYRWQ
jgi:iron complex outermembrane receptor protein